MHRLSSRVNFFLLSCDSQHQQIRLWHQNNGSVNVCLVHQCRRTNVSGEVLTSKRRVF